MKAKIIGLVVICIALILAACTETREELILRDRELSGEILIALDSADVWINTSEYAPQSRKSYRPIHEKIIEFMNMHPKVTVNVMDTSWLTTDNSGYENAPGYHLGDVIDHAPDLSTMPDIIELTPHQVRFAAHDMLHELSFFIENAMGDAMWDGEYGHLLDLAKVDGQTFLLPVRSDPMIVYYAVPIFELLGIEVPDEQWTWDDYFELARRLQLQGYVVGDLLRLPSIEHIINGLGGSYISGDYTHFAGYMDSELTKDAFELYVNAISPVQESYMLSRFGSGFRRDDYPALGMARSSSLYYLFDSLDGIDKGYQLLSMPLTASGEQFNTILLTGLAMTNAAQDKELAWELMKFIVGDGGEDTMDFVTNNTLIIHEQRYVKRPPDIYDEILRHIREETIHSHVSSLSMVPTYVGGKLEPFYEVPWNIPEEGELDIYLERQAKAMEKIRDKMIERGLGASH